MVIRPGLTVAEQLDISLIEARDTAILTVLLAFFCTLFVVYIVARFVVLCSSTRMLASKGADPLL
jgi:phage shock protein PspC (stress-responsive transcriptional regulator)